MRMWIALNWLIIESNDGNEILRSCRRGFKGKGKGKIIPLQAWTGPEGSRRLRLPDFKTIGT